MAHSAIEEVAEESCINRGEHRGRSGEQGKKVGEGNLDRMSPLAPTLGLVLDVHDLYQSTTTLETRKTPSPFHRLGNDD